ncbi:MAG: phosphotransferase [Cyanobacteria bacterium P01_F01_bin.150]
MISPKLCQLLEDCYPIGSVQNVQTLTGGEWNQVIRLICDKGAFVLRISHPTQTQAALAYEHQLLQFMGQRISEVPSPITSHRGSTYLCQDNLLLTLFPFMPGRGLDRKSEAECTCAAQMLARLHQIGLEYQDLSPRPNYPPLQYLNWDNNRIWQWPEVENLLFYQSELFLKTETDPIKRSCAEQIFAKRSEIVWEREVFRDWIAALSTSERLLRFGVVHGDYWRNNVLVNVGKISAVMDWDECQTEWLIYELGRATWEFCKNKTQHTLDSQKAIRFLRSYQEAGGPVPSTEFDLLIPFMRCVRIMEVLFALQQASKFGLDEQASKFGLDEHVLHNLLSLENLQNIELSE